MFFTFAFFHPAYSQSADGRSYGFSLSPQAGFIYGQVFEYVYPTDTKGEFLSELTWDMKPVFYLGLKLDFAKKDEINEAGFFSSLSFKAGIPGDSGYLEDRDWQSIENSALTNFSSHTNKTRSFFSLDAALGFSVPIKSIAIIKTFISGSWMHFAFTGRDGYIKYARDKNGNHQTSGSTTFLHIDNNPRIESLYGDVISYKQNWLLLSPGITIGTRMFHPFSFDLSLKISLITYCYSVDDHLLHPPRTYLDFTRIGLYYEPSVCIMYSFKRIDHLLEFSWKNVGRTTGESYQKIYYGYGLIPNKAGAALSLMDLRYMLRIRF